MPWQESSNLGKRSSSQAGGNEKKKLAAIFQQRPRASPMIDVEAKSYVYWWSCDFKPSSAVAAFDMDHTLIRPQSNRTFPKDEDDWMLMNASELKSKLKSLIAEGKNIVIISNQGGVGYDKAARLKALGNKVARVQQALGVPLAFYASYSKVDRCRKPAPGMWEQLTHDFMQKGVVIDKSRSFYCGDAAGRPVGFKPWGAVEKKDFADTDRRFAINAGLTFYTPEQFFHGTDPLAVDPSICWGLDPRSVARVAGCPYGSLNVSNKPELVVMVGFPGSGKSSLAKAVFVSRGYTWINQDTLKTADKCFGKTNEGVRNPSVCGLFFPPSPISVLCFSSNSGDARFVSAWPASAGGASKRGRMQMRGGGAKRGRICGCGLCLAES
jgi:polynucleotide 5'-kinase 3'-phosphatase